MTGPKLCEWVENNIEETFTFYRLPKEHHKHLKSTNVLERLNQELKRRTNVIRIFPNEASPIKEKRSSFLAFFFYQRLVNLFSGVWLAPGQAGVSKGARGFARLGANAGAGRERGQRHDARSYRTSA
jgi:hypothetical protein